jgi:hypothetical protein
MGDQETVRIVMVSNPFVGRLQSAIQNFRSGVLELKITEMNGKRLPSNEIWSQDTMDSRQEISSLAAEDLTWGG